MVSILAGVLSASYLILDLHQDMGRGCGCSKYRAFLEVTCRLVRSAVSTWSLMFTCIIIVRVDQAIFRDNPIWTQGLMLYVVTALEVMPVNLFLHCEISSSFSAANCTGSAHATKVD